MQNLQIENGLDFFAELKKELENEENDDKEEDANICLITKEKLVDNYITLSCNHKFNYLPLYNEISKQKISNYLETTILSLNQIKCPYCRSIQDTLLPNLKGYELPLRKGVNTPEKYCSKIYDCKWIIKSGKNKGNNCGCSAYKKDEAIFCFRHHFLTNLTKINKIPIEWTEEHDKINKKYTVNQLKEILKNNDSKVTGTKKTLVNKFILMKL